MNEPDQWWTAKECADYLGIKPHTWHAYVRRPGVRNPAPRPVRKIGTTPVWDAAAVRAYAANRSSPHAKRPYPDRKDRS